MPLPVRVMASVVDGVSRAQPVRAEVAVTVDAAAVALGAKLDQLDGALTLVNAIRQSQTFDSHHHRIGLLRGASTEFSGTYRVIAAFRNLTDGLNFEPGALIDSTLVGPGMMHRLQTGRRLIQPASLESAWRHKGNLWRRPCL